MKLTTALAGLCLLAVTGLGHAEYPFAARDLAATCANCHGTNGHSAGGMEALAGAPADRMLRQLMDFRSGDKPATIMHQITRGYTDEQLELIANFLAAQK